MQRYDDFRYLPWIIPRFCTKNAFLLIYVNRIVCEHIQIVYENSLFYAHLIPK